MRARIAGLFPSRGLAAGNSFPTGRARRGGDATYFAPTQDALKLTFLREKTRNPEARLINNVVASQNEYSS